MSALDQKRTSSTTPGNFRFAARWSRRVPLPCGVRSAEEIAHAHDDAIAKHHRDRDQKCPLIPYSNPISVSREPSQCASMKRNGHGSPSVHGLVTINDIVIHKSE